MSATAVVFLIASSLYTGFQWTIRMVVCPQFANVDTRHFPNYERRHQRLVSFAVGPLFAAWVLSGAALVCDPPTSSSRWVAVAAIGLVGAVLALTGLAAVPLHRRLSCGFDAKVHRRLLAADSGRLVLAVACSAIAGVLAIR